MTELENKIEQLEKELAKVYAKLAEAEQIFALGWQRYESANKDRNDLQEELTKLKENK